MLKAYCNIDYAGVSLIDLVPDPEVQSILREAQNKFASSRQVRCAYRPQNCSSRNRKLEEKTPALQAPAKPRIPSEMARAGWEQYLNQLHLFMDQSASRMNAAMLGVDPVRHAAFLRSTPIVQWSMSGKHTVIMTRSYDNVSDSDFSELLDFLIDYAVKASEAYVPMPTIGAAPRESA